MTLKANLKVTFQYSFRNFSVRFHADLYLEGILTYSELLSRGPEVLALRTDVHPGELN